MISHASIFFLKFYIIPTFLLKLENKKNQKHVYKISTDSYITFI